MKDKNTDHSKKFEFNKNVTDVFPNMLERSIPSYDHMRRLIKKIITKNISTDDLILDIGTSTGSVFGDLPFRYPKTYFTGLEISDPMIEKAKENFKNAPNVDILKHDLRNRIILNYTPNIIVSCLTIQFTPIEYRLQILKNLYDLLPDKGIFIFVEKVLGNSADMDKLLKDSYYDLKLENGYSYDEIKRKKHALEGVLVPVTAKWNEELLINSGFKDVDCFWRSLNFAGWIAIK